MNVLRQALTIVSRGQTLFFAGRCLSITVDIISALAATDNIHKKRSRIGQYKSLPTASLSHNPRALIYKLFGGLGPGFARDRNLITYLLHISDWKMDIDIADLIQFIHGMVKLLACVRARSKRIFLSLMLVRQLSGYWHSYIICGARNLELGHREN